MYCSHNLILRSRETYNALTNWLTDARMLASQNIVIILCGNKKDLDTDREVTFLEASRFAQENGKWPFTCHSYWRFKMKLYLGSVEPPIVFIRHLAYFQPIALCLQRFL